MHSHITAPINIAGLHKGTETMSLFTACVSEKQNIAVTSSTTKKEGRRREEKGSKFAVWTPNYYSKGYYYCTVDTCPQ